MLIHNCILFGGTGRQHGRMEQLDMYRIVGYKEGSEWFLIDGFAYYKLRTRMSGATLACGDPRCRARLLAKVGGRMVGPAPEHDHGTDTTEWIPERNEMFQTLKIEVCGERAGRTLNQIYERVAARYPRGAPHLLYEEVLSSMRRWRRSLQPAVPATLQLYGEALSRHPRFAEAFYVGTVTVGGVTAVALAMPGYAACLHMAEAVAMDGTFDVVPAIRPRTAQLLTIHAVIRNHFFHPVVVLMERRTRALYQAAIGLVWRAAGAPQPQQVLADFEPGLQAAITAELPGARLVGCYFHYAQALLRRARSLHLGGQAAAVLRRDSDALHLVRLYAAIATLPAHEIPAAAAEARQIGAELRVPNSDRFADYHQAYWLARIGAERFSVYGMAHRTTNVAEAFHATLGRDIARGPNIWAMTDALHIKMATSAARFEALVAGHLNTRRNMSRDMVGRSTVLARARQELVSGRITLRQYLVTVSRMVELPNIDHLVDDIPDIGAEVIVGDDDPAHIPAPPAPMEELPVPIPAPPAPMEELPVPIPAPPAPMEELAVPIPAPPAPMEELAVPIPAPPAPMIELPVPIPAPPAPMEELAVPIPAPPAPMEELAVPIPAPPAPIELPAPPAPMGELPAPPVLHNDSDSEDDLNGLPEVQLEVVLQDSGESGEEAAQEGQAVCSVCYRSPRLHGLVPCGHLVCERCLPRLRPQRCAMCRVPIERSLRLFF